MRKPSPLPLLLLVAVVALVGCSGDGDPTETTAATTESSTTSMSDSTSAPTTVPTETAPSTIAPTTAPPTTGGPNLTTGPPGGLPPGVDTEGVPDELLALVGSEQPPLDLNLGENPTEAEVLDFLTRWQEWWRWALANRDRVDITAGVDESSPLHQRFMAGEGLVELQPGFDFSEATVIPTADVISVSGTVSPETAGFTLEEGTDAFSQTFVADEPVRVTIEIIPVGDGEWMVTIFELGQL
ncbi:MAG: hypothetical protein GEU79_11185 [Acidimicrobiia bacterium]|nr:hypothetical protein [Acidimicrobiia bacterium]